MRAPLLALLVVSVALAGCAETGGEGSDPSATSLCQGAFLARDAVGEASAPRVRFHTSKGTFVAELERERAPVTVGNFLNLTTSGFYDGTLFHRVVRDFVIQGGDPLSKDEDPANDGTGGPGHRIPDEFHPALRHDAAGVLSMANSGPDTGGSQFFVTLAPTPHLDDRHSVFGRVVEGLDVVRAIGSAQLGPGDRPVEPVQLERVELLEPRAFEPERGAGLQVVVPEKRAEAGRPVRFAVVLQNEGNLRDTLTLSAQTPGGWSCEAAEPVDVRAGAGRVVFVSLTPPAGASGTVEIPLAVHRASGGEAEEKESVRVTLGTLGREVRQGDRVVANYAGILPDGRLFDTSMRAVGTDPEQPKFNTTGGWREKAQYNTFTFTVGTGVIEGFTSLAKTAKVGETVTGLIPAKDAYATGNVYERPLTGRDLVFELEIVSLA